MKRDSEASFLNSAANSELGELARNYMNALLAADRQKASTLVEEYVQNGGHVRDVYISVFQPVQYEIGRLWQLNRVSVAQEHYCTASTQLIMARLYPYVFRRDAVGRTMVGCCAPGELHELGMRMVTDFFEMAGWDTYYLGANIPAGEVARAVKERKADMLGVSATMFYNRDKVERIVSEVRRHVGREHAPIILVGGALFLHRPELCSEVGADLTAVDAAQAVDEVNRKLEVGP